VVSFPRVRLTTSSKALRRRERSEGALFSWPLLFFAAVEALACVAKRPHSTRANPKNKCFPSSVHPGIEVLAATPKLGSIAVLACRPTPLRSWFVDGKVYRVTNQDAALVEWGPCSTKYPTVDWGQVPADVKIRIEKR
jgi:hypothetical protein